MDALAVERSIAEGEQGLQALLKFGTESADQLEAHEAEQGSFKRLLPIGLAAMTLSFAPRGTGDVGPALTQADGERLPREKRLRGRDACSLFGKGKVARTCDRTPGEPGLLPLDAQVNLPERGYSYFWHEWMTGFAVEHPFKASAGFFAQLFALEVAESVVMEVAQGAPPDYEAVYAPRPRAAEATEGALLVVSVAGKGVPLLKAEAAKRKAKWGTGEKRQKTKEALVGVSDTVDPKPRAPEARAARLIDPEAARAPAASCRDGRYPQSPAGPSARQPGPDEAGGEGTDQSRRGTPRAPASQPLGRPARWRPRSGAPGDPALPAVAAGDVCPGHQARRRLPLERGHRFVRGRLQGRQALGAGNADGDAERPSGRRHRRPAPNPHEAAAADVGAGDTRQSHHLLPQPPALDAVRRVPGRGLACRDWRRGVGLRFRGQAPDGGRRPALEPDRGPGHPDVALAQEEPRQ
jgi:hypothetical protein